MTFDGAACVGRCAGGLLGPRLAAGPQHRADPPGGHGMRHRLEELFGVHGRRHADRPGLGGIYARLLAGSSRMRSPGDHAGQPVPHGRGRSQRRPAGWRSRSSTCTPPTCPCAIWPSTSGHRSPSRPLRSTAARTASHRGRRASTPSGHCRRTSRSADSHVGMAVNPAMVFAILDRLAQPEDDWRPFQPPLPVRPWYPRATDWRGAA